MLKIRTIKEHIKQLLPEFAIFLFREYNNSRNQKKALEKHKNLTASNNVSVNGNCVFERGVRAGKNVEFSNVYVGMASYFSSNNSVINASIGRFCSIAPYARIGLGTNLFKNFVTTHPAFYLKRQTLPVCYADKNYKNNAELYPRTTIGNDVWIGENALLKSGIIIGNGAIIGAGAVVTKDVAPYSIVGGVPAKLIRYRFPNEEISFLEEFKWWDKSDMWLRDNWEDLLDMEKFVKKYRNTNIDN